jgi:DNA-binding transcriptional MocR family regulator
MREIITFDGAPAEGTINFSIGQPSADLLPVDLIGRASQQFFDRAESIELNYGVTEGDERFLDSLAGFLTEGYGKAASAQDLFVTGGNSQGLDMVSALFAEPGDTVFVEKPSYFLAFRIFQDHGLNVVGIPMDDDGPCIEKLKHELKAHKPAFLYTIPSYQNPSGQCTTASRRREIVELAEQHDFLIVADEVYQLLNYYETPPIAYGTLLDNERVISLGSFSKILAPGLRTGWIQTSDTLKKSLLASGFLNSGGSISHFSSHIVRQTINDGSLKSHIERLKCVYRERLEAMDGALDEHFSDIAKWTTPRGGYFFWLRFDESTDTTLLREAAPEYGTGFQDGAVFSDAGGLHNFLRVSFAHYGTDDIREGISRMRRMVDQSRPRV